MYICAGVCVCVCVCVWQDVCVSVSRLWSVCVDALPSAVPDATLNSKGSTPSTSPVRYAQISTFLPSSTLYTLLDSDTSTTEGRVH